MISPLKVSTITTIKEPGSSEIRSNLFTLVTAENTVQAVIQLNSMYSAAYIATATLGSPSNLIGISIYSDKLEMRAKVGNHLYTSLGNGDSPLGHFRQVLKGRLGSERRIAPFLRCTMYQTQQ